MLNEELLKISQTLTSRGQVLTFLPNSVLEGVEVFKNETELNEVVSRMANKLNNELILIKNKLIPLMNEISLACKRKIEKMEDTSDTKNYKINVIDVPDVIKEMKSNGFLSRKRTPVNIGTPTMGLAVPQPEILRELAKPKDNGLGIYINQILKNYSDEDLAILWERTLGDISDLNPYIQKLYQDTREHHDDIIILFMILENIRDEKPAGSSVSDDLYKRIIPVFYNEIKNLLSIIYDNIMADRDIKRLVLGISSDGYTINVDKDLYAEYLESGGLPDAIFGIAVKGNFSLENSFLTEVKGRQEEYVKIWQSKVKLDRYSSLPATVNRYKALYFLVLKQTYDAYIPQDLLEYLSNDYYNARAELEKILYDLPNDSILDYNYMARVIVGSVMFSKTNFEKFTDTMLGYMSLNKTFTQQDAATFASFDFIVDYLLNQLHTETY